MTHPEEGQKHDGISLSVFLLPNCTALGLLYQGVVSIYTDLIALRELHAQLSYWQGRGARRGVLVKALIGLES